MRNQGYLLLALAMYVVSSQAQTELINCGFELNMCDKLINDANSQMFSRDSGGTPSEKTGPSTGARGSQFYIYYETSGLGGAGVPARIMTVPLNVTGTVCVSFDYHMFGETTGELTLNLKVLGSGSDSELWSESGEKGNNWNPFQQSFTINNFNERLEWEALSGSSFKGDIALDNIMVSTGACDGVPATPETTPREPPRTTTPRSDVVEGCNIVWQCNFAVNDCGVTQSNTDNTDWQRTAGETASSNTGPITGYQGSGDYYYYLEATGKNPDDTAIFYTPNIEFTLPASCIRIEFYYHMWGDSMGKLEVSTMAGSSRTTFFMAEGDQGDDWEKADVKLDAVPVGPFQLEFFATRGEGYKSDIAVDEIKICDCSSAVPKTTTPRDDASPTPSPTPDVGPADNVNVQPSFVWVGPHTPGSAKCVVRNVNNLPFFWDGIRWLTPQGNSAVNEPGLIVDTSFNPFEGTGVWTSTLNFDVRDHGLSGEYTCEVNYDNKISRTYTNVAVQACKPDEFMCAGGSGCIPCSRLCDQFDDCGDFSDEFKCGTDWSPLEMDRNCGQGPPMPRP